MVVLTQIEEDIQMMLAANVHLGTKNCDFQMERYVWKRRADGIYIINLRRTWDKLQMAARVIVAIENPQDIVVQSARPYGQRAVLKFALYTGAQAIAGRHTPGTFTNQVQNSFCEPRLLILTDPRSDHQPVRESALGNIPTIAFCDTNSPMRYVDIGVPANNRGKQSIGVMFWLLARMVLQMREVVTRSRPWDVMVDLFIYREPEETKDGEEEGGAPSELAPVYVPPPEYVRPPEYVAPLALAATQWEGAEGAQWEPNILPAATLPDDTTSQEWAYNPAVTADWNAASSNVVPFEWETTSPAAPTGWE